MNRAELHHERHYWQARLNIALNKPHFIVDDKQVVGACHIIDHKGKYRVMAQNDFVTPPGGSTIWQCHDFVDWFPEWISLKKTVRIIEDRVKLLEVK